MAPKSRPKSAPRITARSVNSLILSSVEINGRNSPGGAVELHGRSLKESLPGKSQIGCVRDYAAREASGEANLGDPTSISAGIPKSLNMIRVGFFLDWPWIAMASRLGSS